MLKPLMKTLSCIIPAHNEAARIGAVLSVVTAHPLIDEVIVVDDGSIDGTAAVARNFPEVRLIRTASNKGKSSAVCDGIRVSTGSFLMLLDADLLGLTARDLARLIEPVTSGRADFSISLRRNALMPWRLIGLDYVSGERVLPVCIVAEHLDAIKKLPGFGLEVYLNDLILKSRSRIKVVDWNAVDSPYKVRKYGIWKGLLGEVRMLMNIAETVSLARSGFQIVAMLRARVD